MDKKLTKEDIINAAKCCTADNYCGACPLINRSNCITDFMKYILEYMENEPAPAADVQEVKRGYWKFHEKTKLVPSNKVGIKEEYTNGHSCTIVDDKNVNQKIMIMMKRITLKIPICSVCGWCGYDEYDATKYCPNCGARMDGDSNG